MTGTLQPLCSVYSDLGRHLRRPARIDPQNCGQSIKTPEFLLALYALILRLQELVLPFQTTQFHTH